MLQFNEIKAEAIGRWPGIFNSIGVDVGDGRHCPCPICGGKDRFRMDDKKGKGTWFCNQCGAGDGWSLLQKVLGCDFKEAIEQVAPFVGKITQKGPVKEKKISPEILREMFTFSCAAEKNNLVGQYLLSRGLKIIPPTLRYHSGCWEKETKKNHPAMLAIVRNKDGKALTIHRTYLDMETAGKAKINKPKKLMPALEKITGSAIRLFDPDNGRIGLAEGIETAIACSQIFSIPTWSVISSTMMEAFQPPIGIKKIMIFADNDKNYTGQKAAYTLANRLVLRDKIQKVNVLVPNDIGDFLDELKHDTENQ
jgi:putative DNA primase/helicase